MTDNSEEMFPIVDEEGNITGAATRGECHSGSKLLHPVVHLHVFNSKGELYLQKRPEWKDIQPGKWDTSVGGHVDLGESVEMALKREATRIHYSSKSAITRTKVNRKRYILFCKTVLSLLRFP